MKGLSLSSGKAAFDPRALTTGSGAGVGRPPRDKRPMVELRNSFTLGLRSHLRLAGCCASPAPSPASALDISPFLA